MISEDAAKSCVPWVTLRSSIKVELVSVSWGGGEPKIRVFACFSDRIAVWDSLLELEVPIFPYGFLISQRGKVIRKPCFKRQSFLQVLAKLVQMISGGVLWSLKIHLFLSFHIVQMRRPCMIHHKWLRIALL